MMTDEEIRPLAENLAAAVLAYKLGITVGHCLKKYVHGEPLGPSWYALARTLIKGGGIDAS